MQCLAYNWVDNFQLLRYCCKQKKIAKLHNIYLFSLCFFFKKKNYFKTRKNKVKNKEDFNAGNKRGTNKKINDVFENCLPLPHIRFH